MPPTDYHMFNRVMLVNDAQLLTRRIMDQLDARQLERFALRLAGLLATVWPSSHDAELLDALKDEGAKLL
jgi:hypothetical protein